MREMVESPLSHAADAEFHNQRKGPCERVELGGSSV